jgi:hypothetical protein
LISEKVFTTLPNDLQDVCRFIDCVRVKGKAQELNVYEVFGADEHSTVVAKRESRTEFEKLVREGGNGGGERAIAGLKAVRLKNKGDVVLDYWIERLTAPVLA